jgi:hypothetical protein
MYIFGNSEQFATSLSLITKNNKMRIINFSVILILNGDQKEENKISKKNIFLIHTQK